VWKSAIFYIAAVALFLRFYDLPLKPLHHDEGVNTLLLGRVIKPPHVFSYDPANYHGPTLFYAAWLSTLVLGVTTVAIRATTAMAGFAAVLLMLLLRRQLGTVGAISAAAWLALSPGAVYYSRYFIHESLLVCFTLATVVAMSAWSHEKRAWYLLAGAAFAGLVVATKETAIISAAVLAGAVVGATWLTESRKLWNALPATPGGKRAVPMLALRQSVAALRREVPGRLALLGIAVVLGVALLLYTSFLSRWQGAADAVRTFAIWTRTGTTAHTSPWYMYVRWLFEAETALLLLGGAGALLALLKPRNRFVAFAGLWGIGILVAHSVIPYKTPWLTLNVVVPLAITAGYWCEVVWQRQKGAARVGALAGVAVLGLLAAYQSLTLNFQRYDDERHAYVYAHTSREILDLVEEVHRLQAANPGTSIAVTSPDHFPLSWYLRQYRTGYYDRPTVPGAALIIASDRQQTLLDRSLGKQYERFGPYRLRPGVRLVLYARRDLRRLRPARVNGWR
jgi:uncharacterized protein (TIGR03663 family)